MSVTIETGLYVLLLATFVGFEVIRRVPPLFHTPLMSLTNAVAGISLVGSLVVAGADHGAASTALGTIAVTASTINVVGGFLITDRMLKMFRPRAGAPAKKPAGKQAEKQAATTGAGR
jgi:H+-translocating NAD(P) transhydrogenase subunit alpha